MDIQIHDTSLAPGNLILVTGKFEKEEVESFSAYMQVLQAAFPENRVIYIPDESTLDVMTDDEITSLLKDSMTIEALTNLCGLVNDAYMEKSEEANSSEI